MGARAGAAEPDADAGVERNNITYNAAIGACEKGGRWGEALALLGEMRRRAWSGIRSRTRRISACEKGGQWKKALLLLGEMKAAGVELDVITYNATYHRVREGRPVGAGAGAAGRDAAGGRGRNADVQRRLTACEKSAQWERALALLLGEIQQAGVERVRSRTAPPSARAKGGQWERALALLDEMRDAGVEPDTISTTPPSARARRAGNGSERWRCWTRCGGGRGADPITYGAAVSACEKGGQWERALALLGR